jgi:hypothetical protein
VQTTPARSRAGYLVEEYITRKARFVYDIGLFPHTQWGPKELERGDQWLAVVCRRGVETMPLFHLRFRLAKPKGNNTVVDGEKEIRRAVVFPLRSALEFVQRIRIEICLQKLE